MGKGFSNNKGKITVFILLAIFLITSGVYASYTERELFDRGYEYYLSYQPEKAVEEFRKFIKEFPGSSAKDAVLFWLGKSLLQLKSYDEARTSFIEIKQQFPESPFNVHADRELEKIYQKENEAKKAEVTPDDAARTSVENKQNSEKEEKRTLSAEGSLSVADQERNKSGDDLEEGKKKIEVLQLRVQEIEEEKKKTELKNMDLASAVAERDRLKVTLEEEQKKTEAFQARLKELEEAEKKTELEKKDFVEAIIEKDRLKETLEEEKKKTEALQSRLNELEEGKNTQIKVKEEPPVMQQEEDKQLKALLEEERKKADSLEASLKEQKEREVYIINSSYVLGKLGIKEVLWRSGNLQEDLLNEQILFEKAKNLNTAIDKDAYDKLIAEHTFNKEQAEYLYKFLMISELIDSVLKETTGEKYVESLSATYEVDKYRKLVISPELQKYAKNGMAFDEIYKLYSEDIEYKSIRFQELPDWIRERIKPLQNGEVGVVWSENGYMIIKVIMKQQMAFDPFADLKPETKDKLKTFIMELIKEIKTGDGSPGYYISSFAIPVFV